MASLADISEHQEFVPGGHDGYIIRTWGDGNRADDRWRQHYDGAAGKPRGAYGIFRPTYDPRGWTEGYISTLNAVPWELVPTIDIELGDATAAANFAAVAVDMLHGAGYPIVMGYYSRDSAYRKRAQHLFNLQWIACYGCSFPAGADMHQYTSTPYDQNFIPDISVLYRGPVSAPRRAVAEDMLLF